MKARVLVKTEVAALCFMLTVANGTYYWRVRAVDGDDAASTVRISGQFDGGSVCRVKRK